MGCHFLLWGDSPDPGSEPTSPALAGGFFTAERPGKKSSNLCEKQNKTKREASLFMVDEKCLTKLSLVKFGGEDGVNQFNKNLLWKKKFTMGGN